jgi:hypothetical protein
MAMIADILLAAGALAASFYCFILSRRLRRLSDLDKGLGGAIAVLSVQVDDLATALKQTEAASAQATDDLVRQTERAEAAAKQLQLLIAALHDLPQPAPDETPISPFFSQSQAKTPERT